MSFTVISAGRYAVGAPLATSLFGDIVNDLNYFNGLIVSQNDAGGAPLVINGSFESPTVATSTTPNDWTVVAGNAGGPVLSATDQNHGAQSLKFTRDTTGGHTGGTATSAAFFNISGGFTNGSSNQQAGLSYLFTFMIKSSRTDVSNTVVINWYDANQGALSSTTVYSETAGITSWETRAVVITPPVGAMFGKIVISGGTATTTPASTATIYFDGFSIKTRPCFQSSTAYTAIAANTFVVPSGVFFINVRMAGGKYVTGNGSPGTGAYLEGNLTVLPGDTITITLRNGLTASTVVYGSTTFSCGNGVSAVVNGAASGGYLNLSGSVGFSQSSAAFAILSY